MKKLFSLLLLSLLVQSVWSQSGEGYDPENPGDPDVYYILTLEAAPLSGGTVSPNTRQKLSAGQSTYISASPRLGYEFKRWMMGDSLVSTEKSHYFTMPEKDVVLTAYFEWNPEYNPQNPGDPDAEGYSHHVYVYASPSAGGYFNSSSFTLVEGKTTNIYAYPREGYRFESWLCNGEVVSTDNPLQIRMGTEDIAYTATFVYNPVPPGEPSPNVFNTATGEIVIDNFTPGSLNSAIYAAVGSSDNYDAVQSITVVGRMLSSDFGFAYNFRNCSLIDLSRTTGYTEVPGWSFEGAEALKELFLPMNVERIGENAFSGCTALKDIYLYATAPPSLAENALNGLGKSVNLHVPSTSVTLYAAAEGWNQLNILSLNQNEKSITVSLPDDAGTYKNMTLELQNVQSGQLYRCLVTDRTSYTFFGLMKNTYYNIYLKNSNNVVLGEIGNVALDDDNLNVSFEYIKTVQDVTLSVLTPSGENVTASVTITWLDEQGSYLRQGNKVSEMLTGTNIQYRVKLSKDLALEYMQPTDMTYEVKAGKNDVTLMLSPIKQIALSGSVVDAATKQGIYGATVSISQTLNGMYSKTIIAKTDNKGNYVATVYNAPTSLAISAYDYVNQTTEVSIEPENESVRVDDITMTSIIGATINVNLTYTPSVAEGETAVTQNWYDDYQNVAYSIFNVTTGKEVTQVSSRFPQLVILDGAKAGDRLKLMARSKKDAFMPVEVEAEVDNKNTINCKFDIKQLGGFVASYESAENSINVGTLYDENGQLYKIYEYSVSGNIEVDELKDGEYTLVSMGKNYAYNSICNYSRFKETELVEGVDYTVNKILIESGVVKHVTNDIIPFFNEEKYIVVNQEKTSVTADKLSIVAGNYVVLSAQIEITDLSAGHFGNMRLVYDFPASASFVSNSVMIGSQIVNNYSVSDNTIIIPLKESDLSKKIKFCVIPTKEGSFSPSAMLAFDSESHTVYVPIGSANYDVEKFSINVPESVNKTSFTISGTSLPESLIEIYDDNVLVGSLICPASGNWSAECDFGKLYNLSTHHIYAKVINKDSETLSEVKLCTYNQNEIEVKTVTMSYYNAWLKKNIEVVFDMQEHTVNASSYMFYTGTNFTFVADLTNNDSKVVSGVKIGVFTNKNRWRILDAKYDSTLEKWVAVSYFDLNELPSSVDVSLSSNVPLEFDMRMVLDYDEAIEEIQKDNDDVYETIENLQNLLFEGLEANVGIDELNQLNDSIARISGLDDHDLEKIEEDYVYLYNVWRKYNTGEPGSDSGNLENDTEYWEEVENYLNEKYPFDNVNYPDPTLLIESLANGEDLPSGTFVLSSGNTYSPTIIYERKSTDKNLSHYLQQRGKWEVQESNDYTAKVTLVNSASGDKIILDESKHDNSPTFTTDGMISFANNAINIINAYSNNIEAQSFMDLFGEGCNRLALDNNKKATLIRKVLVGLTRDKSKENAQKLLGGVTKRANLASGISKTVSGLGSFIGGWGIGSDINDGWSNAKDWDMLIAKAHDLCKPAEAMHINDLANDYKGRFMRRYAAKTMGGVAMTGVGIVSATAAETPALPVALLTWAASYGINKGLEFWKRQYTKDDTKRKEEIREMISKCTDDDKCPKCGKKTCICKPKPRIKDIQDPSGYVYEGVSSNRLQGVTATAYYMETTEDMYGVLHDEPRVWDAEEYAQENPLFTDEKGMYQWYVPQGLWQVKFEKEGYETTYSEWLPVPPPQLEVNIGMVQSRQPEVKLTHAYKDGIEVEFDKYMMPALLNTENILVSVNGEYVEGEVKMLNEETAYSDESVKYASKVRFVPTTPFTASEVTLTVANRVKSYAGLQMQDSYQQTFDIEQELTAIKADSVAEVAYEGTLTLAVQVLPAEASAGKTLRVKTSSPMIASVESETLVLDKDGKANVVVTGELPGSASLAYTIDGYDLTAQTIVKVNIVSIEMCAAPKASIASGSVVDKGTQIELSCDTEGATIYYTTDGSCPCDEGGSRMVYDGTPIVINKTTTVKAMAVAPGMNESEVTEFVYTVIDYDGIHETKLNNMIQLYPLPVRDILNVTAGGEMIKRVTISTMNGVPVASVNHTAKIVTLDTSSMSTGIYIVTIVTENGTCSRKTQKIQ